MEIWKMETPAKAKANLTIPSLPRSSQA